MHGLVTDLNGTPLPGVNIIIQHSFMGTSSDISGQYRIDNIPPGTYAIVYSMMGYKKNIQEQVELPAGLELMLNVELSESVLKSPQVIVTSARKEQDIMESPFTVVAIGPRDISSKGTPSLLEALSYEAGVVSMNGQLNIRGSSGYAIGAGSRSLLLIDGVPMLGAAAGNIGWDNVPTSEVDHVEIVKSGGSAMYGSSAMGGVVNVITRNAAPEPETRVRVRTGLYSQPRFEDWRWRSGPGLVYDLEASHSRPIGKHAAWVRLQHRQSDGFMRLNWDEVSNLTSKLKLNFSTAHSATLFLNVIRDDGGVISEWRSPADPFESPPGSEEDHTVGSRVTLNAFYNRIYSDDIVLKLRSGGYWNNWDTYGVNPEFSREGRYFAESQLSNTWSRYLSTTSGLTLVQNTIEGAMFGEHDSRSVAGYLLGQYKWKAFTSTVGGRFESYQVDAELKDQVFSPQLALNLHPRPWLALRVSSGQGFRVPTVAEMFTSTQRSIFRVEPNPLLDSEYSTSREFGFSLTAGSVGWLDGMKLDLAIFHNDFEDLVEPTPDSLGIIHFENIADARILGMDIGLGASLLNNLLTLRSAYTWLDPVELEDGAVVDTLSYRYRHHLVNQLGVNLGTAELSIEYRYASKLEGVELYQENLVTGQDERIPVHVWNLGLVYPLGEWQLLLRANNLLQYYYTQLERNMAEERLVSISVSRKL